MEARQRNTRGQQFKSAVPCLYSWRYSRDNTAKRVFFNPIKQAHEFSQGFTGLKITAGERAMSGQNGNMTGHELH